MELLETIKSITKAHIEELKRTRYQPIHMGQGTGHNPARCSPHGRKPKRGSTGSCSSATGATIGAM
jgi:hypothetical protein